VEPQVVVAPLERVPRTPVEVEPRASGDENPLPLPRTIVETFEVVSPWTLVLLAAMVALEKQDGANGLEESGALGVSRDAGRR
jgi:hypothetical protein